MPVDEAILKAKELAVKDAIRTHRTEIHKLLTIADNIDSIMMVIQLLKPWETTKWYVKLIY